MKTITLILFLLCSIAGIANAQIDFKHGKSKVSIAIFDADNSKTVVIDTTYSVENNRAFRTTDTNYITTDSIKYTVKYKSVWDDKHTNWVFHSVSMAPTSAASTFSISGTLVLPNQFYNFAPRLP